MSGPGLGPGREPEAESGPGADELVPGVEVEVEVGPVAHGGHCVARHEGRVLFVRHAIPGERVRARITEGGPGDRFVRADAIKILRADSHRVAPPCRYAGPGGCGGCDLQHVEIGHQRTLKGQVVAEQLSRLAGVERDVVVEALDDEGGLGYRTRVELAVGTAEAPEGAATPVLGLRRHRSHEIVPVATCAIADPRVDEAVRESHQDAVTEPEELAGLAALDVVAAAGEADTVVVEVPGDAEGRALPTPPLPLTELVPAGDGRREARVDARGFWQVHRDAPRAFVEAVLEAAAVAPGERVLDLYAGVGLLSGPLAEATGEGGQLVAVESDRRAGGHLRENLADLPQALAVTARVDEALGVSGRRSGGRGGRGGGRSGGRARRGGASSPLLPPSADVVVLDPPRSGAGREVVEALLRLRPRRVVYVACDPAALARDTRYLRERGAELVGLRALDAFPMTHHVECVATFAPSP